MKEDIYLVRCTVVLPQKIGVTNIDISRASVVPDVSKLGTYSYSWAIKIHNNRGIHVRLK